MWRSGIRLGALKVKNLKKLNLNNSSVTVLALLILQKFWLSQLITCALVYNVIDAYSLIKPCTKKNKLTIKY